MHTNWSQSPTMAAALHWLVTHDDDGVERAYVSRLWAEDWDSPEDAAYDHTPPEEAP